MKYVIMLFGLYETGKGYYAYDIEEAKIYSDEAEAIDQKEYYVDIEGYYPSDVDIIPVDEDNEQEA